MTEIRKEFKLPTDRTVKITISSPCSLNESDFVICEERQALAMADWLIEVFSPGKAPDRKVN